LLEVATRGSKAAADIGVGGEVIDRVDRVEMRRQQRGV